VLTAGQTCVSDWEEAEARSQAAVAELRGRIADDASAA
jgi:hypothetical protein